MQFSKGGMETARREKKGVCVARAKSLDCIRVAELTAPEIKTLLSPHNHDFATTAARQQLLADKRLFDPFSYFGSPNFHSFEDSLRFHSQRLNAMFPPPAQTQPPRTPLRMTVKASVGRSEQSSPLLLGKVREGVGKGVGKEREGVGKGVGKEREGVGKEREGVKRSVGKSPKGYVKQNKQNFMRLNLNNMQKMRVKLKLNKK